MICFDRNTIYNLIRASDKQMFFLTNCKNNGITTFCRCKFINDDVIYLTENTNGQIVSACSTFEEYNQVVKRKEKKSKFFEQIKTICPLIADFLYLLPGSESFLGVHFPSPGTFFRNFAIDLSNLILNLAIHGKVNTFGDFLKISLSKSKLQKVYLIVEHANERSDNFIREINNILNENKQVYAIFCFDDCVSAEYENNFNEDKYYERVFGLPEFKDGGEEILNGENIKITDDIRELYSKSATYKDFKNRYVNLKRKEIEINQNYLVLVKFLCSFNSDRLSKIDVELAMDFLINDGEYVDARMSVEEAIRGLIKSGFLYEDLENGYFQILKFSPLDAEMSNYIACSFLAYLESKEASHIISYPLFKSIFINSKSLEHVSENIIAQYIKNVASDKDLSFKESFFLELARKSFKKYENWKEVYACLFNQKLYKYIPTYEGVNNTHYYFLTKLARSHETIDDDIPNEIKKMINQYESKSIKVLLYILLYDYYDTHNQKECIVLVNKLKSNNKIEDSLYYKYLRLLLAEKEQEWCQMIDMFDKSISDLPSEEAFRAINSKFAFSMMRYIDGGKKDNFKENYISKIANELINHDFFTINDSFVLNNLLVYKYIFGKDLLQNYYIDYEKIFNKSNVSTQTHHYWLNKSIFESITHRSLKYFDFNFFIKFQDERGKESRINSFIYNYFVVSKYVRKRNPSKRVKKLIDKNANFKTYRNYSKYVEINKMKHIDIVNNIDFLIKYGYMVHRTIDIKYLIDELEKEDSL